MVHTRASVKLEHGDSFQEKAKIADENSSGTDEEDWKEFLRLNQKKIDEEDRQYWKKKKLMRSSSTTKQYSRRKNSSGTGIQINEPLVRSHSQPRDSTWIESQQAPSAPSLNPSTSKRIPVAPTELASIRNEQRRLSVEQERLSKELQHISSEHKKIRKKYSHISKMLEGILSKLSCTSSDTSD